MKESLSRTPRLGFTLVEVLVTTVVVGTMAAVVVPAMIKLAPAGDPARTASDLNSVKMAIDVFSQDLRPLIPGDIEDLVNKISTSDEGLDGVVYRQADVDKWEGPYLQWTVDATATVAGTVTIFKSAGGALIHSALYRCPTVSSSYGTGSGPGNDVPCTIYTADPWEGAEAFVAVKVTGIPAAAGSEFVALNDVIDGKGETSPAINGLLRQNASGTVFFFSVPYFF